MFLGFIPLTTVRGESILINIDKILYVLPYKSYLRVVTEDGDFFDVADTFESVSGVLISPEKVKRIKNS